MSESISAELQAAFAEHDRKDRIRNSQLGSIWAMILMPAGVFLDYYVYPKELPQFFLLRLGCSLLVGVLWTLFFTEFGKRHFRVLGMTWYLLPALFIAWMIYVSGSPGSPYYAGLNIVLVGAGLFLPWTRTENLLAGALVMAMYLAPVFLLGLKGEDFRLVFNNLYFLSLTILIVVVASHYHSRSRFNEFRLRFELDANRHMLEESNRKLVELDHIKSRFFANISHELRTPLTLLLAPLDALRGERDRVPATRVQDWLQTMHANGMRLLKLINDLLDLVRLDSGKMQLNREPVEVGELVKGLASAVQKVAQDKGLKLETRVRENVGAVLADRDKLEKVLLNLVFNAIKFTPAGGRIELQAERQGDELVLQVVDSGMGIAANQLPFVFDRFWQADTSAQRKFQGAGIGLALVKELVEAQGGKVSVTSEVGRGTTMMVRIPYVEVEATKLSKQSEGKIELSAAAATTAPTGAPAKTEEWLANLYRRAELFPAMTPLRETIRPLEIPGPGNRPRLLIADDEPDMLRFLKSQVSAHFQVLEAVDGHQAIELASQFQPDAILCDMMMPEKDGLQVCRELRARVTTQNIPIMLLTARADEETKLAALAAGASDFLTKPFSATELHVRLKNLVDSHRLQRQLAWQNQQLEATLEQLKDTETQLVQSEKMASLGRLSAGIIHEINNPLNYTKTGLYTLKAKGKFLPEEQRAEYEEILYDVEDGVNRVRNIVLDLRTFTHPNTDLFETVAVEGLVDMALRLLSHEWKDRVRIERQIPAGHTLEANQNQLIQVLINLLQNALDAIKGKDFGGDLPAIWITSQVEAGKLRLRFRDNGNGIAPEVLSKIFDPFFTTKDVGEGMGLGLSICYRIVQDHGGKITVQSERGKFCEFTLEFPAKE